MNGKRVKVDGVWNEWTGKRRSIFKQKGGLVGKGFKLPTGGEKAVQKKKICGGEKCPLSGDCALVLEAGDAVGRERGETE